jgi:hypothetical protein
MIRYLKENVKRFNPCESIMIRYLKENVKMFNPREYITIRYLQENKKTSSGILLSMSNQTMILDQMPKFWTCINDKLSI